MDNNAYILDFLRQNFADVMYLSDPASPNLCKAATAFANTRGGVIVIGQSETNETIGISPEDVKKISHLLTSQISPQIPFTVSQVQVQDKTVAVVSVWEGPDKPYTTNQAFYICIGDRISIATPESIKAMIEGQGLQKYSWERQSVESFTVDDISSQAYSLIKNALVDSNRIPHEATIQQVVQKMGFSQSYRFTNAAVVVLGKYPSQFLAQTRIRVSLFDEAGQLLEVRMYDSNLIEDVDQIVHYVYGLYPKTIDFDGLTRVERETIPFVALREGILNAVVHRSYESPQSFVAVNIYSDCLEIVNSGTLPKGITPEMLSLQHQSILRNPDIANAFYLIHYIEAAGSGTLRILDACKRIGAHLPIWTTDDGLVKLTFPEIRHSLSSHKKESDILKNYLSKDASVRESLQLILQYISTHPMAKLSEISEITCKSYPQVKRYMQLLKEAGLVVYEGNLRTGGWKLK